MKEKYIHMDVLFQQMQPEILLQNIVSPPVYAGVSAEEKPVLLNARSISEDCYRRGAHGLASAAKRSEDELNQRYRDLADWLERKPRGGVFALLAQYGSEVLRFQQGEPLCRQEAILEWRSRTLHLGQDLIVCASLAAKDVRERCNSNSFVWPPAIHTDNFGLWKMLEQGMAENHFHLNGSTQIFPLAWGYLMNFPGMIRAYFDRESFRDDRKPALSQGVRDNRLPWRTRIYYAAWIRSCLFFGIQRSLFSNSKWEHKLRWEFLDFHRGLQSRSEWSSRINLLRSHGARFLQRNGTTCCLDYAITPRLAESNVGPNRFLAGERYFLYQCFRGCFDGSLPPYCQDLFYLYLLIKRCFRAELIQSNGRKGFHNFSDYQDRKNNGWGAFDPYWEESFRLSIAGGLSGANKHQAMISSLELRVMTKGSSARLKQELSSIDKGTDFAMEDCLQDPCGSCRGELLLESRRSCSNCENRQSCSISGNRRNCSSCGNRQRCPNGEKEQKHFFVLHFAKEPLEPVGKKVLPGDRVGPRNRKVRDEAKKHARALASALARSEELCRRIRGIDACSHEIGCRPETFATVFRYLRAFIPRKAVSMKVCRYWPKLGFTYHVGEDFLDLADGLRAMDEAICFLNMERGDRLGHAMALGIEPEQFYRVKSYCVFLPAQDLLDNLVWLLYRCREWGVSVPTDLQHSLQNRARQLLYHIYRVYDLWNSKNPILWDLLEYYESWKLRGDDPSLYYRPAEVKDSIKKARNSFDAYDRAKLDDRLWEYTQEERHSGLGDWLSCQSDQKADMADIRYNPNIQRMLYLYHFDGETRRRGQKVERFQVGEPYLALIRQIQDCMIEKIMTKGIAVECNPSSNVAIGIFEKYEFHPIFRFNHMGLSLPEQRENAPQLEVSVNTDDQGVFDTRLENEYSLLYGCLQARRDASGRRLIGDDAIYQYLDHLREMGKRMVFPEAERFAQKRSSAKESE